MTALRLHEAAPGPNAARRAAGWSGPAAQADLLHWLRQLYEVAAWEAPCLDAVPLLPFAGWSEGASPLEAATRPALPAQALLASLPRPRQLLPAPECGEGCWCARAERVARIPELEVVWAAPGARAAAAARVGAWNALRGAALRPVRAAELGGPALGAPRGALAARFGVTAPVHRVSLGSPHACNGCMPALCIPGVAGQARRPSGLDGMKSQVFVA
jgi:hypothetical protein